MSFSVRSVAECELSYFQLSKNGDVLSYVNTRTSELIFVELLTKRQKSILIDKSSTLVWANHSRFFYLQSHLNTNIIQGYVDFERGNIISNSNHLPLSVRSESNFSNSSLFSINLLPDFRQDANMGFITSLFRDQFLNFEIRRTHGVNKIDGKLSTEKINSSNNTTFHNALYVWVNEKSEPFAGLFYLEKNEQVVLKSISSESSDSKAVFSFKPGSIFYKNSIPGNVRFFKDTSDPNSIYSITNANSNRMALYKHSINSLESFEKIVEFSDKDILQPVIIDGIVHGVQTDSDNFNFIPLTARGAEIKKKLSSLIEPRFVNYKMNIIYSSTNYLGLNVHNDKDGILTIFHPNGKNHFSLNYKCNYMPSEPVYFTNTDVSYFSKKNDSNIEISNAFLNKNTLVVYSHGGPKSRQMLYDASNPVLDNFYFKNYAILRFNYLGGVGNGLDYMNLSSPNSFEQIKNQLSHIEAFARKNGFTRIIFFGESFGGYLSILLSSISSMPNISFIAINPLEDLDIADKNFGLISFNAFKNIKLPSITSKLINKDIDFGVIFQGRHDKLVVPDDNRFEYISSFDKISKVTLEESEHSLSERDTKIVIDHINIKLNNINLNKRFEH